MKTVELFGRVGDEKDGTTERQFLAQMNGIRPDEDLHVIINSIGGHIMQGLGMYSAMVEHQGMVEVEIRGIAGSIASVAAMAADRIVMHQSSRMMIHNAMGPSKIEFGNAEQLRAAAGETLKTAEILESISDDIAGIYADRTGQSRADVHAMMDAETMMNSQRAVELGFADSVRSSKQLVACIEAKCEADPLKTEAELVAVAEACSGLKVRNRRNTSIELLQRRKRQQRQLEAVLK